MSMGLWQYTAREDYLLSGEDMRDRGMPSIEQAKRRFLPQAIPCPLCKMPPEKLSWVYLVVPKWACKDAAGQKGWVTICDQCKRQINFFVAKE
jgi:hypothetical protein